MDNLFCLKHIIEKKGDTGQQSEEHPQIYGETFQQVYKFIINSKGTLENEINKRIAKSGRVYNGIKNNF